MSIDTTLLNETQIIALKRTLQTVLRVAVIEISFQKEDGSIRKMMATLNDRVIGEKFPDFKFKSDGTAKPENYEVVTVFDFEKGQWRSFRVDRLETVGLSDARTLLGYVTRSV